MSDVTNIFQVKYMPLICPRDNITNHNNTNVKSSWDIVFTHVSKFYLMSLNIFILLYIQQFYLAFVSLKFECAIHQKTSNQAYELF